MTETLTTISLKKYFKYPFQEPNWQGRFLVGSVLILAGFFIPMTRIVPVNRRAPSRF